MTARTIEAADAAANADTRKGSESLLAALISEHPAIIRKLTKGRAL